MFPITGDTYEIRDRLSALGCTWAADEHCWFAPDEARRSQAQALADAEPMRKWRTFCDGLAWVKGSLSASTLKAAMRAASLGVPADEVCRLAEERIAAAGAPVKPEKIKRDVRRGYDFAQKNGEKTSNVERPTSNVEWWESKTAKPKETAFERSKLARFAAPMMGVVDVAWLADRSAIDPLNCDADRFLRALYRAGEKVVVLDVFASQGQWMWSPETGFAPSGIDYQAWDANDRGHESPPPLKAGLPFAAEGPQGIWYLTNPVDGSWRKTNESDKWGRPKWSRRSEPEITSWRYFTLESDIAGITREWVAAIVQLPLPIAAIYTSGGKSVHVLLKVDAASKAELDLWRQTALRTIPALGGDPDNMTSVRLSRLPGCRRLADGDGNAYPHPREQRLLYLTPDPEPVPICQRPTVRDTLRPWLHWAEATVGCDREEIDPSDVERLEAGLSRFSNCTAARDALAELRRWKAA